MHVCMYVRMYWRHTYSMHFFLSVLCRCHVLNRLWSRMVAARFLPYCKIWEDIDHVPIQIPFRFGISQPCLVTPEGGPQELWADLLAARETALQRRKAMSTCLSLATWREDEGCHQTTSGYQGIRRIDLVPT